LLNLKNNKKAVLKLADQLFGLAGLPVEPVAPVDIGKGLVLFNRQTG
jgi:hypothetical protein